MDFQTGQRVQAKYAVQGMKKDEVLTITKTARVPSGIGSRTYATVVVVDAEGRSLTVNNPSIVLVAVSK